MIRLSRLQPTPTACRAASLGACAVIALASAPAFAEGTLAGSVVRNTATATYETPGGSETTVNSNTVTLTVDEVLAVSVASGDPGDVSAAPAATGQLLRFTITNIGNGSERFALVARANAGGDDFDPSVTEVVLDANGNGAYDAGVDTVYSAGSNDPELAPDSSLTVFVRSTIPAGATDGQRGRIDLVASAMTGTGAPGTRFAGQGQGGGNAIVGLGGGTAEDDGYYRIQQASVSFVKTATVLDPFGQSSPVPGSIITYSLAVTISGSGNISNLRVADPIPDGTTYSPGTITLDGAALTDADDSDAGRFTGSGIAVGLGTMAAGSQHTITFQVRID